jgi:hypothetical protein
LTVDVLGQKIDVFVIDVLKIDVLEIVQMGRPAMKQLNSRKVLMRTNMSKHFEVISKN